MSTYMAKKSEIVQKWYLIDAKDKILGQVATKAAVLLRGKHKTSFTPHVDTGDFVIIINAASVRVTGKKADQKIYKNYSGYPGGLKEKKFKEVIVKDPVHIVRHAVSGMIPKGPLGRKTLKKLKVYAEAFHPHEAQMPEQISLK